ncbi:MAG: hypothetical protein D6731_19865 [Planctomycetota bacterium]|nr:MAG: hypothetical protein D6731_19865 [Planctomycetota bacterium]
MARALAARRLDGAQGALRRYSASRGAHAPEAGRVADPLHFAEKLAALAAVGEGSLTGAAAQARVGALLADPAAEVRAEAARAARRFATSFAEELFARLDREDEPEVRARLCEALGAVVEAGDLAGAEDPEYEPRPELGEPRREVYERAKAVLLDAARGQGPERAAALEALAVLPWLAPVREGVDALLQGTPDERRQGLRCVARSGDRRWSAAVVAALDADDDVLAGLAAEAAGRMGAAEAAPGLVRLLHDEGRPRRLRAAAIAALGRLGAAVAAPALLELAEAPEVDGALREAARAALAESTPPPSPFEPLQEHNA